MGSAIAMEELEAGLLTSAPDHSSETGHRAYDHHQHHYRPSGGRGMGRTPRQILRHLSLPPISVPLSPTTRLAVSAQQADSGRQTRQIFPINAGAFIHRHSIKVAATQGDSSETLACALSLVCIIDCIEPTLIRLMADGQRKPLGETMVDAPCLGRSVAIPFRLGRGKKQQHHKRSHDCYVCTEPLRGLTAKDPVVKTPIKLISSPLAVAAAAAAPPSPLPKDSMMTTGGGYAVQVQEQRLCFRGKEYEILEIYGQSSDACTITTTQCTPADNANDTAAAIVMRDVSGNSCVSVSLASDLPVGEEHLDCVVCLCEPRDTLFMPCRHLCICSGCAESFARGDGKCPLCRQGFESMMSIFDESRRDASEGGASLDHHQEELK